MRLLPKIIMTLGHYKRGYIDWKAAYMLLRICLPSCAYKLTLLAYLSKSEPDISLPTLSDHRHNIGRFT